ncbi:MAG: hypothetical protein RLY70_1892 [Planctomycetota bacterium]
MRNRLLGNWTSGKRMWVAAIAVAAAGWSGLAVGDRPLAVSVAAEQAGPPKPAPVEESMHEFMEYVFEPAYKRLKTAMATAPTDNAGWKAIKGDSLPLAEAGNLLLTRLPEDDATAWAGHSAKVRDFGGQLYGAAKKKDFAAARKAYESMIQNCNACHDQFAGGSHILKP